MNGASPGETLIASPAAAPTQIVSDDITIYWSDVNGSVWSTTSPGGQPTLLFHDPSSAMLPFLNLSPTGLAFVSGGTLHLRSRATGSVSALAPEIGTVIAGTALNGTVYLLSSQSSNDPRGPTMTVSRIELDTGRATTLFGPTFRNPMPARIAASNAIIVMSSLIAGSAPEWFSIRAATDAGVASSDVRLPQRTSLAYDATNCSVLASGPDMVFCGTDNGLYAIDSSGAALPHSAGGARAIVTDSRNVYWIDGKRVAAAPLTNGATLSYGSDATAPVLGVDSTFVYWFTSDGIVRRSEPP